MKKVLYYWLHEISSFFFFHQENEYLKSKEPLLHICDLNIFIYVEKVSKSYKRSMFGDRDPFLKF